LLSSSERLKNDNEWQVKWNLSSQELQVVNMEKKILQIIFIAEFSAFRSCSSHYHSMTPCSPHLNHFEPEDEIFTSPKRLQYHYLSDISMWVPSQSLVPSLV